MLKGTYKEIGSSFTSW